MNENESVEKQENHSPRGGSAPKKIRRRYEAAFKLRAVKLHLEEGFTLQMVAEELGVCKDTIFLWVSQYREFGEERLRGLLPGTRAPRLPTAVREKIIALKGQEPSFGIKRISQLLRRVFFLKASPETVRQTLKREGLIEPPPKPRRNVTRPRFFERATPNQLWQSDIFMFQIERRQVYLIGFMDDYSRFIVGAGLFHSHTTENVLEVFRSAVAAYQPPREMLTDNGRQYASWRGKTRFQKELHKERIVHIRSTPHHPQTLGKIERFWATLHQEFLSRAKFDTFESARERIRFWIQYYNFKRPNQGIEGLCPADRFFEVASQVRKTIEEGIQENLLEMALRGQPQSPFYMVGRLQGQSVILRTEEGKLKLSIDNGNQNQELTYDLNQNNQPDRKDRTQKENPPINSPQCPGQSSGGAGGVDRALQASGCLPSVEHQLDHFPSLAAPGDGRHASGSGEPCQLEPGRSVEPAAASPPPASATLNESDSAHAAAPTASGEQACQPAVASGKNALDECQSQTTGRGDLQSPLRPDDCHGGSPTTGHLSSAVLPMGTAGVAGAFGGLERPADRPAQIPDGPGETKTPTPDTATGSTAPATGTAGAAAPTLEPMGAESSATR